MTGRLHDAEMAQLLDRSDAKGLALDVMTAEFPRPVRQCHLKPVNRNRDDKMLKEVAVDDWVTVA